MNNNVTQRKLNSHTDEKKATRWISRGFEALVSKLELKDRQEQQDFDVLIVGSGYGGAVAAAELAGWQGPDRRPLKIGVLERGNEYLAGMFPSNLTELPAHLRMKVAGRRGLVGSKEGLFDIRPGNDVNVLLANGLGGGSLINAGVMAEPDPKIFIKGWPKELGNKETLQKHFDRAKLLLGAAKKQGNAQLTNTVEQHAAHKKQPLRKYAALKRLTDSGIPDGNDVFRPAPITVAMQNGENHAGVQLNACKLCADCATGCNHGAKDSLDLNLLVTAHANGAEIFTGATVLKVEPENSGWTLETVYTDQKLRERQGEPVKIRAARVILAAGTLGSTEILLRSATADFGLSPRLGQRFSANGDMLAFTYNEKRPVNAVADEAQAPERREIGPTITGMVDLRNSKINKIDNPAIVIEEMAVPAPIRHLFEQIISSSATLHSLQKNDWKFHGYGFPANDPCAVDKAKVESTSIIAIMGDDGAAGRIELPQNPHRVETDDDDGSVRVIWPGLAGRALFDGQIDALTQLHKANRTRALVIPNPVWRLLPKGVGFLLGGRQGPPLTVHPLGGCAMGDDSASGVVNQLGQVFCVEPKIAGRDVPVSRDVHDGLVVMDGSVVPTALGINPALTITALAFHAVESLKEVWRLQPPIAEKKPVATKRPVFRETTTAEEPTPTRVRFVERLSGDVPLSHGKHPAPHVVELTLEYEPKPLLDLVRGDEKRNGELKVDERYRAKQPVSRIRIFRKSRYDALQKTNYHGRKLDEELDKCAEFIAPLTGSLTILKRRRSNWLTRSACGLSAWFRNRGMRDIWQARLEPGFLKRLRGDPGYRKKKSHRPLFGYVRDVVALASRAGEVRLFEYDLKLGQPIQPAGSEEALFKAGDSIRGSKRITYSRRSNPWRQLQELRIHKMPGLRFRNILRGLVAYKSRPLLKLDTVYLANRRIPLFKVVGQQDQARTLADLVTFGGYFLRLFLSIHVWALRKPDTPRNREPQRLPGTIPGMPEPQVELLEVDRFESGEPVNIRLTRYPCPDSSLPPILMIHGYSASGTTFAHHAVRPNMAEYLLEKKRDVWILDMRTSSGMPTATHPWCFEEVAYADIPAAVDFVWRQTGRQGIDIVAHCMGSAMLSMAVLSAGRSRIDPKEIRHRGWPWTDKFHAERCALPDRIRRVVLTQVGPLVVFSPENTFRAYAISFLQEFLPLDGYKFRVGPNPSLGDQIIDRLLATLPYPEEEFDLENPPWWTFWKRAEFVGPRHRMDALYGRDFSLKNIGQGVLDHIDDHFGPLSIGTLSQTIEFALHRGIADHRGHNRFVTRNNLSKCWQFPTLSIHGKENGLADVRTLYRMRDVLAKAGRNIRICELKDFGHQDALVGKDAGKTFKCIEIFLSDKDYETPKFEAGEQPGWIAEIPAAGPIIGRPVEVDGGERVDIPVRIGANPMLGNIIAVAFLPVNRSADGNRFIPVGKDGAPGKPPADFRGPELDPFIETGVLLTRPEKDANEWLKTTIRVRSWTRNCDGILVLPLYDQLTGIDDGIRQDLADLRIVDFATGESTPYLYFGITTEFTARDKTLFGSDPTINNTIDALSRKSHEFKNSYFEKIVDPIKRALETEARYLVPGLIEFDHLLRSPDDKVSFALGSCQYPAGMLDRDVAYASYRSLAQTLDSAKEDKKPSMVILAGDQVYVDATAGLFDPRSSYDRFDKPYHTLFSRFQVRDLLRRLPSEMMLDDHEIEDNWEPLPVPANLAANKQLGDNYLRGLRSYIRYQRSQGNISEDPAELWYEFEESGFRFFMLDTRADRQARRAGCVQSAAIIGAEQFADLQAWIEKYGGTNRKPMFIVSPSVVLPRHRQSAEKPDIAALRSDTWDGYPASLYKLLALIADREIQNIVFLSGDLHLSCVTDATVSIDGTHARFHSICSSGLYTPFPFANSGPEDLMKTDRFKFLTDTGRYTCSAETQFAPCGEGFALLHVHQNSGGWIIDYDFQGRKDPKTGAGRIVIAR